MCYETRSNHGVEFCGEALIDSGKKFLKTLGDHLCTNSARGQTLALVLVWQRNGVILIWDALSLAFFYA